MELGMVSDAYRPGIIWKMSMRIAEFSATLNTPPPPQKITIVCISGCGLASHSSKQGTPTKPGNPAWVCMHRQLDKEKQSLHRKIPPQKKKKKEVQIHTRV